MSETAAAPAAPTTTPASTPTTTPAPGSDGKAPNPALQPLGQSPRLRDGMSLDEGIAEAVRRRARAKPGRPPAAASDAGSASPPGAASPQPPPAPRTNGAAPPANGHDTTAAAPTSPAAADPMDALIRAYRDQHAPAASPAANDAQPTAPGAPAPAANSNVRLSIGGQAREFTHDQLIEAVSKSADYTKKTRELAEFHKRVNEQAETINRLLPVIVPEVERQIAALDAQLGKHVDWQKLAAEDPAEYQKQDAAYKVAAAERERLAALQQINQQESEAQRARRLEEGHATLTKMIPGWDKPETRGQIQAAMKSWGQKNGFPAQELGSIYEPRHVHTLFKAMAFDSLMAKVASGAPVVPNVGAGGMPQPQRLGAAADAEAAFNDKPNVTNATALWLARRKALN